MKREKKANGVRVASQAPPRYSECMRPTGAHTRSCKFAAHPHSRVATCAAVLCDPRPSVCGWLLTRTSAGCSLPTVARTPCSGRVLAVPAPCLRGTNRPDSSSRRTLRDSYLSHGSHAIGARSAFWLIPISSVCLRCAPLAAQQLRCGCHVYQV